MRSEVTSIVLCLAAATAHADEAAPGHAPGHASGHAPGHASGHAPGPASDPDPALGLEAAVTWSGQTVEPTTGWRAALVVPLEAAAIPHHERTARFGLAALARFDDHGAPAEYGVAETRATSWGAGLRAMTMWASSNLRFGAFLEGTVGRTRARHADMMAAQHDDHWMLSGGILGGTRTVQVVADFGWLVTDAGDGRIGPIASLGLHLALD